MVAWQDHLSSDPSVCGGDLCAAGTRVPVTVILDSLAEGATREEILTSYPSLDATHIDAARLLPLHPGGIRRASRR